ncbi:MAG: hypothetical protein JSV56_06875 [Methanomassiliicoccales archaeon]|nr:MAG: hypothetical protein JSV56_06875 [Methanomassiliicoccales archaeon]
MENDEENPQEVESEDVDERIPSLLEVEKRLSDNEGKGIFECPQCGTGVVANAPKCPHCNVEFEEVPMNQPSDLQDPQMPTIADLNREQIVQTESEEPKEIPQPENTPTPKVANVKEPATDSKFVGAISEYYEKRKRRYLLGALSLGLGVILFALLWLVVVHQVLVTDTENLFGFEVLILLLLAGVFFVFGLFLTLTYPSSSLAELLVSMPMNVPPPDPRETDIKSNKPSE